MTRTPITMQLDDRDVVRWASFASREGWNMLELVERAVENFMREHGAEVTKHHEDELVRIDPET